MLQSFILQMLMLPMLLLLIAVAHAVLYKGDALANVVAAAAADDGAAEIC